jgi:small-conductance mechanosensitive channel
MYTGNPFADLTAFLPPLVMQVYIVLMIFAVAAGTLFDMLHKNSARFFLRQWKKTKANARRPLGVVDTASLAAKTVAVEVATSGEFRNPRRRISHLLMFYGFLTYLITTVVMIFGYPTGTPTPVSLPVLWNIGALMALIGGYWFFFRLRVNVAKEGHSPFRVMRADLFILSLLASVSFALIWEVVQATAGRMATQIVFGIYILFTTLLFVGVPWSKFAHMFYKPAAAFQRRVEEANGSSSLPRPSSVNNIVR